MERSAKNYLCALFTAGAFYFMWVFTLKAHEVKTFLQETGNSSGGAWMWYLAAALMGIIAGAGFCWMVVSKSNLKTPAQTFRAPRSGQILMAGAAGGLLLGYGGAAGFLLPSLKLPSVTVSQPQEEEESKESGEAPVLADAFPLMDKKEGSEEVPDVHGVLTIDDAQELYDYYESSGSDESSIVVQSGGRAIIMGLVSKYGDASNPQKALQNGVNAAVYVRQDGSASLLGGAITTDAAGAPGFAVNGAASAELGSSTIHTSQSYSELLFAANQGSINGTSLSTSTAGDASPALISRSSGLIAVDASTFSTLGQASPFVYGNGAFQVTNCNAQCLASPAATLWGSGSLQLDYSSVTSGGSASGANTVFDVDNNEGSEQTPSLSMTGTIIDVSDAGSGLADSASLFHVKNGSFSAYLNGNVITLPSGLLCQIQKAAMELELDAQSLAGTIQADAGSSLELRLENGAILSTSVNSENSGAEIHLVLDASSTLALTGDCYVSSLDNAYGSNDNIAFNGYTLYVDGQAVTQ